MAVRKLPAPDRPRFRFPAGSHGQYSKQHPETKRIRNELHFPALRSAVKGLPTNWFTHKYDSDAADRVGPVWSLPYLACWLARHKQARPLRRGQRMPTLCPGELGGYAFFRLIGTKGE
jgi:hypothetical protein